MFRIPFLAAAALLAGSLTLAAQEPSSCPAARPCGCPAVQKVFAVADLVVPCPEAPQEDLFALLPCCPQAGVWSAQFASPARTEEDKLIKLIVSRVRPSCWAANGGKCTIEYFPIGMGLVVHAPDDVQVEVAELLDELRKRQDQTIEVRVLLVTVSDNFLERFGLDTDLKLGQADKSKCQQPQLVFHMGKDGLIRMGCDFECPGCCSEADCCPKGCSDAECRRAPATCLDATQVRLLLEAAQMDPRVCLTQCPRMSLQSGRAGTISMQDQQQFVTGLKIDTVDGQPQVVPQTTTIKSGSVVTVRGSLSDDSKRIEGDVTLSYTYALPGQAHLFPVSYMVPAAKKAKTAGPQVPVTQYLQQPRFATLELNSHLSVPCGHTMMFHAGVVERNQCVESRVPLLSSIPYVNRLFRKVSTTQTKEHMLVLVTPDVKNTADDTAGTLPPRRADKCAKCPASCPACPAGSERASAAADRAAREECLGALAFPASWGRVGVTSAPCPATPVPATAPLTGSAKRPVESRVAHVAARLVQKYHEACAHGQSEQAREFAQMALDLDPACFTRPFAVAVPPPCSMPMMPAPTPPILPAPITVAPMLEPAPPATAEDAPMSEDVSRVLHRELGRRLPPRFTGSAPAAAENAPPSESHSWRFFHRVLDHAAPRSWVGGTATPPGAYQQPLPQTAEPAAAPPRP